MIKGDTVYYPHLYMGVYIVKKGIIDRCNGKTATVNYRSRAIDTYSSDEKEAERLAIRLQRKLNQRTIDKAEEIKKHLIDLSYDNS